MKWMISILAYCTVCSVFVHNAHAHGGGTNADGCHTKKKTGEYHCHNSQKGQTKTAKTEAKFSAKTEAKTNAKQSIICVANLYNCSDFSSHSEAQNTYEYCLQQVGDDVHDLDRDSDGIACEALQ